MRNPLIAQPLATFWWTKTCNLLTNLFSLFKQIDIFSVDKTPKLNIVNDMWWTLYQCVMNIRFRACTYFLAGLVNPLVIIW